MLFNLAARPRRIICDASAGKLIYAEGRGHFRKARAPSDRSSPKTKRFHEEEICPKA
ncbi:hypothetical protein SBA1_590002 [Candidatus Sulfotelmatobacter kueseliae]|uniref:Uncharacterized protein n=1 Tax=Candidatus Sulfotelmatobacter kueseliae TaxID=2042962 RepID=A0A2U3L0J2_9BACT|nr:hypothetical protein SBA1_590002 [Candidatus Sulfotelmatobacter kueseliae]